jgi:hypothetical protein
MARILFQQSISPRRKGALQPQQLQDAIALTKSTFARAGITPTRAERRQIVALYNKCVTDGRFIGDLAKNPRVVARKLRVQLSESAADQLIRAGEALSPSIERAPGEADGVELVAVAIIVLVLAASPTTAGRPAESVIVDSSGLVKL